MGGWSFLTNHGLVLVCIAAGKDVRLSSIADCVGITERATHHIVCELEEAGFLTRHRGGRTNVYEVHPDVPLRHPLEKDQTAGELLSVFLDYNGSEAQRCG